MFLTVLSTHDGPVGERERALYAGRMRALTGTELATLDEGGFYAIVAPAMVPLRPLIGRRHGMVAIGNVRLDNREEVRSWTAKTGHDDSDLELLLEAYHQQGARCIPAILGDFAFVIYDLRTRTLIAGRDAFGVRTLFIGKRVREVVLSSHLEPVHDREDLDEEFVADFLLCGDPGPERTIWADSCAVTQGSVLSVRDGQISRERFWTPFSYSPEEGPEREQVEHFQQLFREAVRSRTESNSHAWAELSGGLDSSSVVVMAETLATSGEVPEGLAGTVSIVDELGDGNERRYSDLVVNRFGLRNEVIANPWPWQDDGMPPPRTDEPRTHYAYFCRDRLECEIVRRAGSRVLLSGLGADHYLYGNRWFIADSLAHGAPVRALSQLATWAVAERQSFWTALARDVALPFLPRVLQRRYSPNSDRVPPWIEATFARRVRMASRLRSARTIDTRPGNRFATQIRSDLQELTRWLPRGSFEDGMELRYPFLYRPLVEAGLRLPVSMLVRPLAPKWVLRQAMRRLLPEEIRNRQGKGGIDSRIVWALSRERDRIDELLHASVLAQAGVIRLGLLRDAIDRARLGDTVYVVKLLAVLSLEAWLFVRSGRWNVRNHEPHTVQDARRSPRRVI